MSGFVFKYYQKCKQTKQKTTRAMDSVDLDTIFDDIKKVLISNGWDKPLPIQFLENHYKDSCKRELSSDCMTFGLSVEDFIVRSDIFRLFLNHGKTHVYLAPEKLEQPLPAPTSNVQPPKRFKRKKKRQNDVSFYCSNVIDIV